MSEKGEVAPLRSKFSKTLDVVCETKSERVKSWPTTIRKTLQLILESGKPLDYLPVLLRWASLAQAACVVFEGAGRDGYLCLSFPFSKFSPGLFCWSQKPLCVLEITLGCLRAVLHEGSSDLCSVVLFLRKKSGPSSLPFTLRAMECSAKR